jgi:hypothetical protein
MPVAAENPKYQLLARVQRLSKWWGHGVFFGFAALCAIWLDIAVTMREPPYVTRDRGIRPVYRKRWFTSVKKAV